MFDLNYYSHQHQKHSCSHDELLIDDDVCVSSVPVACCSHRGVEYPRPHSTGSGSTTSTTVSQSSSSSGRGSLPPVGCPGNQSQVPETGPAANSFSEALANNELNSHHLCQYRLYRSCEPWKPAHNYLMDSSDSPGEYISFFSGSDISCLSAIGGEVIDSSSSFVSESSKLPLPLGQANLKMNSSPASPIKRPGVLSSTHSQADDVITGKSTEV
ncbi:uncharacterized protein LOC117511524 [Thalassophryne amazonica]|uniref:uncharacterized protein LOC117511524 n=1 Tax=Thalassophryne amazonica TaxID=390379 RepID=UPI0014714D10|nr:uncharacterized protein LOC117511524 [Thalassophryne amazonica]